MKSSNYDLQLQAAERYFLRYDMEKIAAQFGLRCDKRYLYLPFLGQTHRIDRVTARAEVFADNEWLPSGFHAAMTLFDMLTNPNGFPVLSGQWCAHTSLNAVQGGTLQGSLMISPERSAAPFTKITLRRVCEILDAQPDKTGDYACVLPLFPFFSVLLRYWEADEEFPAQLQILWDKSTTRYLHYETTFYTTQAILDRLYSLL